MDTLMVVLKYFWKKNVKFEEKADMAKKKKHEKLLSMQS